MFISNSIIYICGGAYDSQGSTYNTSLNTIGLLSDIIIDVNNGSNLLCAVDPSLYSCYTFEYAASIFSGYSGLIQSFLFKAGASIKLNNTV